MSDALTDQLLRQYDSPAARAFYRQVMGGGGPHIHYGIFPDDVHGPPDVRAGADRAVAVLGDQLVAALGRAPTRMLDVGSGTGGPAVANAARFGCTVVGLNLCPDQNADARRLAEHHGVQARVRFHEADFDAPWPDLPEDIDAVWSQEALCHSTDKAALLGRIAGRLAPGGVLAFTDVLASERASAEDLRAFTRLNATTSLARASDYRQMLAVAGFELQTHTDLTVHLERTFEAMLHEVRVAGRDLVDQGVTRAHLERYEASLEQRIRDAADSPLAWGAFVARRTTRRAVGTWSAGVRTERALGAFAGGRQARPVLIIGAGHVGTFLAKTLAQSSEVVLKYRSPPRAEVRAICERHGVDLVHDLGALAGTEPSATLLATKTFDHASALAELSDAGISGPRCAVFNGLVDPDVLPGVVPCVTFGSWDFAPGGTDMIVRNPDVPWQLPPEGAAIADLLQKARIPATASDDFRAWQLRKFLVNAAANLLSVRRDQHCAGLLAHHREELAGLLAEIVDVLSKDPADAAALAAIAPGGAPLTDGLRRLVEDALRSYGTHHPSTWHDHHQGRRIEVDTLNGYVVAAAARHDVPVPRNAALVAAIAEQS